MCYIMSQCVPRSKHSTSVIKTKLLMMYKAKVTVSSESHAEHINAVLLLWRIFEC